MYTPPALIVAYIIRNVNGKTMNNDQITNQETATILELAKQCLTLPGDFVELGCYKGETSVLLGKLLAMVIIKADFALEYRAQMAEVLTAIEGAPGEVVYISPEIAKPKKLPFINLGQDETFAEWALPYMTVYGKDVRSM